MSYFMNSSSHTLDKCQKILRMFEQIDDRPINKQYQIRPSSGYKQKPHQYYVPQYSSKKSNYRPITSKPISNSKSPLQNNISTINTYQSTTLHRQKNQSKLFRQKSNSSFVSSYKKESRLDQIMKLKVPKPNIQSTVGSKAQKKMMMFNTSLTSLNSSRSSLNKQNINKNQNKESRLHKIMNIKVEKPKVNSTMIGYEPKKCERSLSKSTNKKSIQGMNSVFQLKDCKKKLRKSTQLEEKQDRLWKLFEREREQQLKQKKREEQSNYKQQRRQEEKFEKLVQKELKKIEQSKQISLRKQKAFSQYVYPSY